MNNKLTRIAVIFKIIAAYSNVRQLLPILLVALLLFNSKMCYGQCSLAYIKTGGIYKNDTTALTGSTTTLTSTSDTLAKRICLGTVIQLGFDTHYSPAYFDCIETYNGTTIKNTSYNKTFYSDSPTRAGYYTYYFVDNLYSCSYEYTITVDSAPTAIAGSNAYICLEGCNVCMDKSTVIGSNSDTMGNTYAWSVHRSGSPLYSSGNRMIVAPTVNTTYYLTVTKETTGCANSDSVVIKVGTNDTLIGDSATMGWYGHRHDCHNTAYDIVITGDSSIYGTFNITENPVGIHPQISQFIIKSSKKTSDYYMSDTAKDNTTGTRGYTINNTSITGGINTKLSWVPNKSGNLQIYSAWHDTTKITLAGVSNLSLTANAPYQTSSSYEDSSPRVPTIIISPPAYNNTFNQIEINGYAVPVKDAASHFSYIAAEMDGAFSFTPEYTNSQLIIEEGCELFLNGSNSKGFGCTLQSTNKYKGWGGIKIDGSQYWFAGPLASQVTSNSWPYAPLADSVDGPGYRGQGIGALYAKNAKIINADSCTSGYGINVGYQYTNSADNQGSAVFIAEGTTFVNSSINFWGPDSSLWVDRGKTHKITDTGRNQNVSYFKNDSFVNSTVTLNNINFAIGSQATFQGCTFTGKNSAKGALGNLYSNFSTFSAYNNTFIKCDTGMYILGGIFQQDIEENNFNCVNIGLRAISTKNLFAFQNNFIIKGAGTDTSYGLRMENCPYLYAFNNNFIGAGGNSVGLLAYKNSGASLIRYNYFTSLYIGAMNLALNPKIQYHCNIFSKNTKTIS